MSRDNNEEKTYSISSGVEEKSYSTEPEYSGDSAEEALQEVKLQKKTSPIIGVPFVSNANEEIRIKINFPHQLITMEYELQLLSPDTQLEEGNIYINYDEQKKHLNYAVINPQGEPQNGSIEPGELGLDSKDVEPFDFRNFKNTPLILDKIVKITSDQKHTFPMKEFIQRRNSGIASFAHDKRYLPLNNQHLRERVISPKRYFLIRDKEKFWQPFKRERRKLILSNLVEAYQKGQVVLPEALKEPFELIFLTFPKALQQGKLNLNPYCFSNYMSILSSLFIDYSDLPFDAKKYREDLIDQKPVELAHSMESFIQDFQNLLAGFIKENQKNLGEAKENEEYLNLAQAQFKILAEQLPEILLSAKPYIYKKELEFDRWVEMRFALKNKEIQQKVQYLDEKELARYEVHFENGKPYISANHPHLNFLSNRPAIDGMHLLDNKEESIFVIKNGKMYIGEPKAGLFHHSSFMSGGRVEAAGSLIYQEGKEGQTIISNSSGHYTPNEQEGKRTLVFLAEKEVISSLTANLVIKVHTGLKTDKVLEGAEAQKYLQSAISSHRFRKVVDKALSPVSPQFSSSDFADAASPSALSKLFSFDSFADMASPELALPIDLLSPEASGSDDEAASPKLVSPSHAPDPEAKSPLFSSFSPSVDAPSPKSASSGFALNSSGFFAIKPSRPLAVVPFDEKFGQQLIDTVEKQISSTSHKRHLFSSEKDRNSMKIKFLQTFKHEVEKILKSSQIGNKHDALIESIERNEKSFPKRSEKSSILSLLAQLKESVNENRNSSLRAVFGIG